VSIAASIHRTDMGSHASVKIGDQEYETSTTSEAHNIMSSKGRVTYIARKRYAGGSSVEHYKIHPVDTTD
jgi:N-formylglutamate amidohydrolase